MTEDEERDFRENKRDWKVVGICKWCGRKVWKRLWERVYHPTCQVHPCETDILRMLERDWQ
jgi:hypothetical protein